MLSSISATATFSHSEQFELSPPDRIRYQWRFLGTGPLDTITWRVVPQDIGCLITVTDAEPGRTREEARELREGWLDFSGRLELFLRHREDTRYTCRSEFEGSIELPAGMEDAWDCLSAAETQALWLPLDGPILKDGARLAVVDDAGQLRVKLSSVAYVAPTGYRFRLKHPSWFSPMDCALELTARRDGTLLKVRHGGWGGQLNVRGEGERLRQRKRFSALWVGVLRQARWLVEQTSNAKTQVRHGGFENRKAGANP